MTVLSLPFFRVAILRGRSNHSHKKLQLLKRLTITKGFTMLQVELFNDDLISEVNGELLVSSIVLAENMELMHDSIISTIEKYQSEFSELGTIIEQDFKEALNISNNKSLLKLRRAYRLNENQTNFLFSLSRNTPIIVRFKLSLTKAFSIMKQKLSQNTFKIPQTFSEALLLASKQAEQIEHQNKLLLEQKPKVDFFEAVTGSKDTIDMGCVAKVLNKKIGRNKLFDFLRENKILMPNNVPYQKFCDCGYFRVIETKYNKPDGSTHIGLKTLVYQKGVNYINKLLGA